MSKADRLIQMKKIEQEIDEAEETINKLQARIEELEIQHDDLEDYGKYGEKDYEDEEETNADN